MKKQTLNVMIITFLKIISFKSIILKKFSKNEIPDLEFQKAIKKPIPVKCIQINEPFEVETIEGIMKGKKVDYLIVGIHGDMYPIDQEIFLKTYDVVKS